MGRIHGHVTNPTGEPQTVGWVSLSTDGGSTLDFTFTVSATGEYSGEAVPGTYMAVYRAPDTPPGKIVDSAGNVTVAAGQEVGVDVDMSRQEFVDKMPPEQKKELEDLKRSNAEAKRTNAVIMGVNADLRIVNQDIRDAEAARATAVQSLGASASASDITNKTEEIQTAKYTEIETLMTKDTGVMPGQSILWVQLGRAQAGLNEYPDAETSYKRVLTLESAAEKPNAEVISEADADLGEVYARRGLVHEANAAFDAAVKAEPDKAALDLRNEAVIFYQERNADAQVAAANEAIQLDANQALLYYIKGEGLVQSATIDPKTGKVVLPPGCIDAYQKYLELAPNGQYAAEVASALQQSGQE
jgi:tetratricopeptide (TPR) repeat protein